MKTKTTDEMYDQLMGIVGDALVQPEPEPKSDEPAVCWTSYTSFFGPRWTEEDLQRMHGMRRN